MITIAARFHESGAELVVKPRVGQCISHRWWKLYQELSRAIDTLTLPSNRHATKDEEGKLLPARYFEHPTEQKIAERTMWADGWLEVCLGRSSSFGHAFVCTFVSVKLVFQVCKKQNWENANEVEDMAMTYLPVYSSADCITFIRYMDVLGKRIATNGGEKGAQNKTQWGKAT